jgi:hypothetical protein
LQPLSTNFFGASHVIIENASFTYFIIMYTNWVNL